MTPIDYMLIGIATILAVSGWTLWKAIRRADEGYEDSFGFHTGAEPALSLRMEASMVGVDGVLAMMPVPRRRRSGNSRAPFKAASASPFEQPAPKRRRAKRVDSNPPIAVSTQAIINTILGQESTQ